MWNHLALWAGESEMYDFKAFLISGGKRTLAQAGTVHFQRPYFYRDGSVEKFRGTLALFKLLSTGPPFRVGEDLLVQEPLDIYREGGRRAWQYLVGQRRVRRAPTIAYDNPNEYVSGYTFYDEFLLFNGALDRYDWKLVGKQEMFVPYNDQRFHLKSVDDVLGPDHINPDELRWELHRVWIVEATLARGKRHIMPRRRFYLDEDGWNVLLSDGWGADGGLWHVGHMIPLLAPELPAVLPQTHAIYDVQKRGYVVNLMFNEGRHQFEAVPRQPDDAFSPAALAAEGVR
jgi:hypothetical protein